MNNPSSRPPLGQIRTLHFVLFFIATSLFLYLRTFLLPGTPLPSTGDETLYFIHGIRILHGQLPFRDYFTYVMPGVDLFYAGVFGIFGVHAWLARTIEILLGGTTAVVLVWISRRVLSGWAIFLPALLFLVLDFDADKDASHHWYSTLLLLTATGLLLAGRSTRRVLAAGTLCGLAALFTQSQGLLGLIVIAGYLWWTSEEDTRHRMTQLVTLVLPFAILVGSFLSYFIYRAGFASVYYALVTFVFLYFPGMRTHTLEAYFVQFPPHHGVKDMLRFIPYLFIHLLVPFGYLYCLLRLFREKKTMDRRVWESVLLINLIGLALFAAIANAPSLYRMYMIAPPATIVCVWLVSGASSAQRTMRGLLWVVAIVAMVALPFQLQRHWRGYVDLPMGRTAFLDPVVYEKLRWLAENTHAGESFVDGPELTFALSLDNPMTVDYVTQTEYTTREQVAAAIEGMERHQTRVVALFEHNYAPTPRMNARGRPGSNLAPFLDYVYKNYHLVKVFPALQIWERN
jgi:hypothetical protein